MPTQLAMRPMTEAGLGSAAGDECVTDGLRRRDASVDRVEEDGEGVGERRPRDVGEDELVHRLCVHLHANLAKIETAGVKRQRKSGKLAPIFRIFLHTVYLLNQRQGLYLPKLQNLRVRINSIDLPIWLFLSCLQ